MRNGFSHASVTRAVVVDDEVMFRQVLADLLKKKVGLADCAQADGASAALRLVEQVRPHLVILDLGLRDGDGLELIKDISKRYPGLPVLVVSMQDECIYAERAIRAGARGYVMKDAPIERLIDGIHVVLSGDVFVSPRVNARLLRSLVHHRVDAVPNSVESLSNRELEVFHLIGSGMGTRAIAIHLGISPKTVETHRENIKQKLCLRNAVALVQAATRQVEAHAL